MKKITCIFILAFVLFSCSDKLTDSKAKKIIENCINKNPLYEYATISKGNNIFISPEKYKIYKDNFINNNYLTITNNPNKNNYYNLELTNKSEPFIETKKYIGRNRIVLKTNELVLKKIESIHEIPSLNIAEVTVNFEKKPTPFSILSLNKDPFITKKIILKKTNNDWIKDCK